MTPASVGGQPRALDTRARAWARCGGARLCSAWLGRFSRTTSVAVPARAAPGDLVAVVAPSGPPEPDAFWRGLAWVRERYRVRLSSAALSREGYLAGDDARRERELSAALGDPEVKAVVVARGGYGAMRVLERLRLASAVASPRWIVGFSDVTALHVEASAAGLASVHGPNVTGLGRASPMVRAAWIAALERPGAEAVWTGLAVVHPGKARGQVWGGNLALLDAMAAAGRLAMPERCVLVMEEVDERPYRVDRMLTSLRMGGYLSRAAAIVFGGFTGCGAGPDGVTVESGPGGAHGGPRRARAGGGPLRPRRRQPGIRDGTRGGGRGRGGGVSGGLVGRGWGGSGVAGTRGAHCATGPVTASDRRVADAASTHRLERGHVGKVLGVSRQPACCGASRPGRRRDSEDLGQARPRYVPARRRGPQPTDARQHVDAPGRKADSQSYAGRLQAKSVSPASGAPNLRSASITRGAFSCDASTHTSRSLSRVADREPRRDNRRQRGAASQSRTTRGADREVGVERRRLRGSQGSGSPDRGPRRRRHARRATREPRTQRRPPLRLRGCSGRPDLPFRRAGDAGHDERRCLQLTRSRGWGERGDGRSRLLPAVRRADMTINDAVRTRPALALVRVGPPQSPLQGPVS